MIVIDRKSPWILELAWLLAFLAEPGHERAIVARECLHSIVVVGDEQETSMMVELKAERGREQAIGIGWLLGANRELDSSISIKKKRRIVSHCGGGKYVTMCDSASEYTSESSEANTTHTHIRGRERASKQQPHAHTTSGLLVGSCRCSFARSSSRCCIAIALGRRIIHLLACISVSCARGKTSLLSLRQVVSWRKIDGRRYSS